MSINVTPANTYHFDAQRFDATTFGEAGWYGRQRDDYGRSVLPFHSGDGRQLAVVVTLPKSYREVYGKSHLVNLRVLVNGMGHGFVQEFTSLKEAKASVEEQVRILAA